MGDAFTVAHNEMSYSYYDEYLGYFMMGCVSALSSGGESLIGDNVSITHKLLSTKMGRMLWDHGIQRLESLPSNQREIPSISHSGIQRNHSVSAVAALPSEGRRRSSTSSE